MVQEGDSRVFGQDAFSPNFISAKYAGNYTWGLLGDAPVSFTDWSIENPNNYRN